MKKTILLILILSLFAACLGPACRVSAAEDSVEEFARDLLEGIRAGRSEVQIDTPETDIDSLLAELFRRYPALFQYFDGASWQTWFSRAQVTVALSDTHLPPEQIPVVDGPEALRAVLGTALADLKTQCSFICTGDFYPEVDTISAQLDWLRDNHYLIWMGYGNYTVNRQTFDGIDAVKVTVDIEYRDDMSLQTLRQWRSETQAAAETLLSTQVALDMPDYEKVLRLHDWIIEHTRYDSVSPDDDDNHMAYGALVQGSCVCQGYAEAFLLMAQAAGLEVHYVTGDAVNSAGEQESHAWNAVKVQGEWYMIDLTWDDPLTSDGSDILRYDYFLISADQLAQDHTWDRSAFPACSPGSVDADWVLAQHEQDQSVYGTYDPSALTTLEESRAQLEAALAQMARPLPGQQQPLPTQPPATEPPATKPVPTPTTKPVRPEPEPREEASSGIWILVLVLAAAVVLSGATVLIVLRAPRRSSRSRSSSAGRTAEYYSNTLDDW